MIQRLMLVVLLGFALSGPTIAAAQTTEDVVGIIQAQADTFGVNGAQLVQLGYCESSLRPWMTGDRGTSHGLFQINSLPTGLLPHFLAAGYSDPYEPWQAAAYVARVAVGEWAATGITLARWSCWRR